MSDFDALKY